MGILTGSQWGGASPFHNLGMAGPEVQRQQMGGFHQFAPQGQPGFMKQPDPQMHSTLQMGQMPTQQPMPPIGGPAGNAPPGGPNAMQTGVMPMNPGMGGPIQGQQVPMGVHTDMMPQQYPQQQFAPQPFAQQPYPPQGQNKLLNPRGAAGNFGRGY